MRDFTLTCAMLNVKTSCLRDKSRKFVCHKIHTEWYRQLCKLNLMKPSLRTIQRKNIKILFHTEGKLNERLILTFFSRKYLLSLCTPCDLSNAIFERRRHCLAGHLFQDRWKDQGRGFILLPPWPPNCFSQMLTVRDLSQHLVSSSKTIRPNIPRGARCMGHCEMMWSAVCSLAPHYNSLKEQDPICTWTNRNVQHQNADS